MKYGVVIPRGEVREIIELAAAAEAAGWDGAFYYDAVCIQNQPMFDPWVVMAGMAMRTERIRLGAILTPLSRRRPWKVARETVTLDHLSSGRLILPVGLGALDDAGFGKVGEPTDRRVRAELLDESLDIITGLWRGEPFSYQGEHYQIEEMTFVPPPVQQPRIPIWVATAWPRPKSMRRALRYDGLLPNKLSPEGEHTELMPDDIRAIRDYVEQRRADGTPFDIVQEGATDGDDPAAAAAAAQPWADAGASWWLEARWSPPNEPADMLARIRQGPPRID